MDGWSTSDNTPVISFAVDDQLLKSIDTTGLNHTGMPLALIPVFSVLFPFAQPNILLNWVLRPSATFAMSLAAQSRGW
jgi:hypothetical protein